MRTGEAPGGDESALVASASFSGGSSSTQVRRQFCLAGFRLNTIVLGVLREAGPLSPGDELTYLASRVQFPEGFGTGLCAPLLTGGGIQAIYTDTA